MMDLTVKGFDGKTQSLRVDGNTTVGELKQLTSPYFGVHPSHQKLSANNGTRIDLEDDSRTLSSYALRSGSTVMLLIKAMQVFVKNVDGLTSTYDVTVDETVCQLQRKIYNKLNTPPDQQRLVYQGIPLESGKKLQEYNITHESTIHMTLRLRGG